jgi:hypothetical protein
MRQAPYNEARPEFWIMDNGSSHRGEASVCRLTQAHPRLVPVHAPVHASWLNQIEIYFSMPPGAFVNWRRCGFDCIANRPSC